MTPQNPGYGADIPYLRDFKPMLAPAWLDHVALVGGIDPPDRRGGFAWCDLGCGQGVTAAILAATHPGGTFEGIDAMEVHVDHGRRLAAMAAITNVRFHAADFAALDRKNERRANLTAHRPYRARIAVDLSRFSASPEAATCTHSLSSFRSNLVSKKWMRVVVGPPFRNAEK